MNHTTRILYVISAWQPACPLEMIYEGMKAKTAIQAATVISNTRSTREHRVSDTDARTGTNHMGCVDRPRERTATGGGKGDAVQMIATDELGYTTRDDVNIAILREIGKIKFRAKLRTLAPLVAQALVSAGVDFSKVDMSTIQEPTDAEIDAIFEDLS